MPRTLPLLLVLGVCAGGVVVPAAGRANPLDAFGYGGRAIALGGAYTGLASDSSATYYNPAGLAQGDDLRFDLGYMYASPSLRFDGGDANVDTIRGIQGGLVMPGELLGVRFGVGIGMMVLDERVTRVRSLPQQQPRFVLFDNRLQRLFISANLALEVWDGLYIGGGVTFFSDSYVDLDITGTVSLLDSARTELQASVGGDLKSVRYPSFGILYAPEGGSWSVGLVYRDEFFLRLDLETLVTGRIVLDTDPEDPLVLVEDGSFLLRSLNANLFTPRQVVLGGSYRLGDVTFSADVGWYQWSAYPAETARVDIVLDLQGLDFAVPPTDPVAPARFHDLVVPRVGVEGRVLDSPHVALDLRGGYFFEASPAPDQTGGTNYADANKHGLSFGLGLAFRDFTDVFPKPLLLDLTLLYIRMVERTYLKDDPADLVGDYGIDGHVVGFSAMLGVEF
jgi:long-chain fatty acid transport protein